MRVLVIFFVAVLAKAGGVQGTVIEHASSRPLARTIVRLDPVPSSSGAAGQPLVLRSGPSGGFVFAAVPPGLYVLTALRGGYFPATYGQRVPAGRGAPISVTTDSRLTVELRMRHRGALTGRVLDENGVGTPGVPVIAYRASLPLRAVGRGTSDDRGMYRIAGLEHGKYWVRSGPHTFEDGSGWLSTFGPQGRELRDAQPHVVSADMETGFADILPESGPLFSVGGWIVCEKPGPVSVTLSSETGQLRDHTECGNSPGSYQFKGLAAGEYEIRATAESATASAFGQFTLAGNLSLNLSLQSWPTAEFEIWKGGSAITDIPIKFVARLHTLSEVGSAVDIAHLRTTLAPGYWSIRGVVPDGYYVESINNLRTVRQGRSSIWRSSDAFDIFVEPQRPSRIRVTLSDQACKITGNVKTEGRPAAGAPVFLWPLSELSRRSLGGAPRSLADTDGNFVFNNLPPGDYRALASFDLNEIDEEVAELGRAALVHCKARQSSEVELSLWAAPL